LQRVLEKDISKRQYGFISHRKPVQALKKIYELSMSNKYIYEFDLEACFNRITNAAVVGSLHQTKLPKELIHFIEFINITPPRVYPKDIQLEKELEIKELDGITYIHKSGMPQGLP